MKELKDVCKKNSLLLTSSFVGEKTFLYESLDFPVLSQYFDFIQFALHEYDPPLEAFNVNYALASRNIYDLENVIVNLIKMGVPSSKILAEVIFMGIELNFMSLSTKHLTYYQICDKITNSQTNWIRRYDSEMGLEIATQKWGRYEYQVLIFENSRSIANKIRFAVKHNLAGALVSCVNTDDYAGRCKIDENTYADYELNVNDTLKSSNRNYNTFPLLNTVNDAIEIAVNTFKQNS